MSSRARRMRARSSEGTLSRRLRAGPARTTTHGFLSAEFIERDVIAMLVCRSAAPDRAQLGCCWCLLRDLSEPDVRAEGFADEFRSTPVFCPHGILDLLRDFGRQRNGESLMCSHRNPVLRDVILQRSVYPKPEEFASAISQALESKAMQQRPGSQARALVERK
jgi:hypothetical protein